MRAPAFKNREVGRGAILGDFASAVASFKSSKPHVTLTETELAHGTGRRGKQLSSDTEMDVHGRVPEMSEARPGVL